MEVRPSGRQEDDDEFAFERMGGEVGAKFGGGAGEGLLELFGEFAGDEHLAFGAQFFFDFVEEFEDAVSGFVEHDRRGEVGELAEASSAGGGFMVEKAIEEKAAAFTGAAEGDGGGEGGRAGNDGDEQAGFAYGGGGAGTGVGQSGHPGIGDEGQGFACADAAQNLFDAGAFIELMAGDHGGGQAVAVEEPPGVAGVFGEDMGGVAQDAQGAQGDVFQVADGRADQVEAWREWRRRRPRGRGRSGGGGRTGAGGRVIRCPSPPGGWCAAWPLP